MAVFKGWRRERLCEPNCSPYLFFSVSYAIYVPPSSLSSRPRAGLGLQCRHLWETIALTSPQRYHVSLSLSNNIYTMHTAPFKVSSCQPPIRDSRVPQHPVYSRHGLCLPQLPRLLLFSFPRPSTTMRRFVLLQGRLLNPRPYHDDLVNRSQRAGHQNHSWNQHSSNTNTTRVLNERCILADINGTNYPKNY